MKNTASGVASQTCDPAQRLSEAIINYVDACFAERDAASARQEASTKRVPGDTPLALARQDQEKDAIGKHAETKIGKQKAASALTAEIAALFQELRPER